MRIFPYFFKTSLLRPRQRSALMKSLCENLFFTGCAGFFLDVDGLLVDEADLVGVLELDEGNFVVGLVWFADLVVAVDEEEAAAAAAAGREVDLE